MSDKKKDDRLEELMMEFLGDANAKDGRASEDSNPTDLDNTKMLEAIDGQRAEINALRKELEKIKSELNQATAGQSPVEEKVVVPEIVALQKMLSQQKEQINKLENEQQTLHKELKPEKRERVGTFGMFGWVLLFSNILLWSILAYWFWEEQQTSKNHLVLNKSDVPIKNEIKEDLVHTNAAIDEEAPAISDTAQLKLLEHKAAPANETNAPNSMEKLSQARSSGAIGGKSSAVRTKPKSRKVVRSNRPKANSRRPKNNVKRTPPVVKKKVEQTTTEEPAVRFGD